MMRLCSDVLSEKLYEVDPFVCSRCGSEMKILAVIIDSYEIMKILKHLVRTNKTPLQFFLKNLEMGLTFKKSSLSSFSLIHRKPRLEYSKLKEASKMRMRWLGKTGLQISELCLGTATFGGIGKFKMSGELDQKGANQIVDMALDAGINFFNTAEVYSDGLAEEIMGKALGTRRKDVIVISKVWQNASPGKNNGGLSRRHIMEACEASLSRISTDYIDIYELHGIDSNTSLEETMRALDDLVRQGKVRYIGCSNFSAWQLMKCMAISEKNGWNRFITLESMYSLAARGLEYELIPACLDQGLAVLAYSPLHAGLLSGKYRRDKPWPTGTRIRSQEKAGAWAFKPEILFKIVDELDRIAKERNVTVAQVALNYIPQKPGICSIIIAVRNAAQMEENLKAAEWQITPEEVARLDEVSEPERMYPYSIPDPNAEI